MYGFEGAGLSEVQLSISELSVVGGGGGGPDKRTSWSDLVGVRQKCHPSIDFKSSSIYSFVVDIRHTWAFFQFARILAPSVQSGRASGNVFGQRGTNCFQSLVSHQMEDLSYRGGIVAESQTNIK